jgi:mono/diheme cytochrome c family protein
MKRDLAIAATCWFAITLMTVLLAEGRLDGQADAATQSNRASPASAQYRAQLDTYCVTCHNQRTKTAGLLLDTLDLAAVPAHAETWEKVIRKLRTRMMPPAGQPRPDAQVYDGFASWLENEIDRAAAASPNPGTTAPFHRLNRAEYQNVIRDLLDLEVDVRDLLPPDDASYGFDNIGGVLKITQPLMERYLSAARRISRLALGSADTPATSFTVRLRPDLPQYERVEGLPFGTRGGTLIRHTFPLDADYDIKLQLGAGTAPGPRQLELSIDGERVRLFSITPPVRGRGQQAQDPDYVPGDAASLQLRVPVKAGPRQIAATFIKAAGSIEIEGSRSIFRRPGPFHEGNQLMPVTEPFLGSIIITGPFNARGAGDTPSRRRVLLCQPARPADETDCVRRILTTLARRAFRRPVAEADVRPLLTFFSQNRGGGFEAAIELTLRRLLVHPEFLFRIEAAPQAVPPGRNYRVSDLELASRLSFFLWSSLPDDELLDLAAGGQLRNPAVLDRQVRRLLADPRSGAFVSNFAGQWLYLRNLEALEPESFLFPDFEDSLRQAMRRETELFFDSILRENRSALDLLTADYTFVNERLARHYGIPNVYGSRFRRVTIPDVNRRGLLGQASILFATSRPNRTSPVLRGKWILQNILGVVPPDPPPNIPAFPERSNVTHTVQSVRERLAQHRASPACASCHAMIDPPGFALEHFDTLGRWRDLDESMRPVDASGALPDGTTFNGAGELRRTLLNPPTRFVTTLTEKLFTYALGRGLEYYDAPAVRKVVRETAADDYRFSSLIVEIVRSLPFQMSRRPS